MPGVLGVALAVDRAGALDVALRSRHAATVVATDALSTLTEENEGRIA